MPLARSIARFCDHCKQYGKVTLREHGSLSCPKCQRAWGSLTTFNAVFDQCPVCGCRQFYLSKDFNQFLGCLIMLVGIILVPFTYALSLPVFALIDWFLHRKVPTIINCYKCGSEFHGFSNTRGFRPFLHHIGLKYDKYR